MLTTKLVYHFWKREARKIAEIFHRILIQIVVLEIVWNVQKSLRSHDPVLLPAFSQWVIFYNREAVTTGFDVIWRDFEHEQKAKQRRKLKLKQKLEIDYGYYFEKGRSQSEPEEDQKENNPVEPSWLEPVKLSVIGGSTSSSILSDSAFEELLEIHKLKFVNFLLLIEHEEILIYFI